jgi:nucleotide-binding universal stress UspA family protein
MKPIKTILHPTDFSEHSQYALELAIALARVHGAGLIVLHSVPGPAPVISGGRASELTRAEHGEEDLKSYRDEMLDKLHQVQSPDPKVEIEHVLTEGDVSKSILRTAEESACDLIVMGSHGKSFTRRVILGSVAANVTRKAPCPVVTVKLPFSKMSSFRQAEPVSVCATR